MSGDVQPRKRRDKKKKKDQADEPIPQVHSMPSFIIPNDDTNIHVHKEKSIGGGFCAKSIFFIITIIIAIAIGVTITEHRGLTDIDIPLSESRFASIFEGWIDAEKSLNDHDEGVASGEISFEPDEKSPEEIEEEDETIDSEEHELDDEDFDSAPEDEDGETEEESDETESNDEDEDTEEQDDDTVDEDEEDETIESEEQPEQLEESEELFEESEEQPEESEELEESEERHEESEEPEESKERRVESDEYKESQNGYEEEVHDTIEERDASQEQLQGEESKEDHTDSNEEDRKHHDNDEQQILDITSARVAVKFGVGVALLIVAYIVLIKKWKSDKIIEKPNNKGEETPNLSRRNTIIPPPTLEEVELDMENIEDEYSEEEELDESEEEIHIPASKRQYEELRATYTRSLTPENKLGDRKGRQYEEYDDEEEVEEEEVEEEEDEEERDEIEYDDDDDDDEYLMNKLEEKYGKLYSRGLKKYEEEEEQETDVNVEEDCDSWKRIKVLPDNGAESESDDDRASKSHEQNYNFDGISNTNEYALKEDLYYDQKQLPNE